MSAFFAGCVAAAFAADTVLDWRGGDVTLAAPIELEATTWKFGFGLRMNGAKVVCDFNDATKYAITVRIAVVSGAVVQAIGIRNLQITDCAFSGPTTFAGALKLECLSNGSGIYSWMIQNVSCENHAARAYALVGSVFEGWLINCRSTGGVGALDVIQRGLIDGHIEAGSDANGWNPNANNPAVADGDKGLPSALYVIQPNFRDGSGDSIDLSGSVLGQEPFDLTIQGGYIVSNGGRAVIALSGIKLVDGTGVEANRDSECAFLIGYRGGRFRNVTGANNQERTAYYLVRAAMSGGKLVLEDCHIENEGEGTGAALAKAEGAGTVYSSRNEGETITSTGPTVLTAQYAP